MLNMAFRLLHALCASVQPLLKIMSMENVIDFDNQLTNEVQSQRVRALVKLKCVLNLFVRLSPLKLIYLFINPMELISASSKSSKPLLIFHECGTSYHVTKWLMAEVLAIYCGLVISQSAVQLFQLLLSASVMESVTYSWKL